MNSSDPYAAKRQALQDKFMSDGTDDTQPLGTDGVHHLVLISSDLEATVRFYTGILNMRLTKVVQNRDDPTSTHIFLDMGGGNLMAFFDFPEHGSDPVVRGIGAMHHVALKATKTQFSGLFDRLDDHGITYDLEGTRESGSVYLRDPDNALIEVTCR